MSRFFPISPPGKRPDTPEEAYHESVTWAHRLFRNLSLELGSNPLQVGADGELEFIGEVLDPPASPTPTKWIKVMVDGDPYYLPLHPEI